MEPSFNAHATKLINTNAKRSIINQKYHQNRKSSVAKAKELAQKDTQEHADINEKYESRLRSEAEEAQRIKLHKQELLARLAAGIELSDDEWDLLVTNAYVDVQ
jgi:galactokinase